MQRCEVCNGRTIRTETGYRCMNAACQGASADRQEQSVTCKCGETMEYGGLDLYGAPSYYCSSCGAKTKL